MTSPSPLSPLVEICLKCESHLQYEVTNNHYSLLLLLTEKISSHLRHSLQGNILSASSLYIRVFNRQFWQQNLATSMLLVKCLLLTTSFLSSRKHMSHLILNIIVIWLYVPVMSCTRLRVNPHSIVAWMSRNSLLEAGAKSEGEVTATGLQTRTT